MSLIIKAENLTKIYKVYDDPMDRVREALSFSRKKYHTNFTALENVNLEIRAGQSVGLVGVNGSGKSTLLQLIAKVLTPTAGKITVNGKVAAILELGAGFNPEFSGLDNIKFHCDLMEIPNAKQPEILKEIERFAGIGDFIRHPVRTYSSGMYVRLAFAAAIMVDPDVLIVDEALAVGDIRFQTKCLKKIREFRDKGKTLLFVSHDAGAVKTLCDHAYLLKQGKIEYDGTPDSVIKYYNNMIALEPDAESDGDLVKRSGTGKARIDSVKMYNSHGTPTDTFTMGEKVELRIEVDVFEDLSSPTVGFSFHDRLGNEIFGINNHNMDKDFGDWKKGDRKTISYFVDLQLGQNVYSVSVSCHPQDTHLIENYDWLNDAYVFKVIPSADYKFVGACYLNSEVKMIDRPHAH